MKKTVLALIAALTLLTASACGDTAQDNSEGTQSEPAKAAEPADLVILLSDISETAKFYPVNIDGTDMEVFAVRDSKGNIKTAFNTCQSCYSSGNGRYELEGTDLVCQNCGFHFTADQVGQGANGGCSPWAIKENERIQTDDSITISYEFLVSSKDIFANWK